MNKKYVISPVKMEDPMKTAKVLDLSKSSRIKPQGKGYAIAPTKDFLAHSAKGTTWEKHDYIKVENGKYYYPDDYKGGRHLPKGETVEGKESSMEPAGWESKFYPEFEANLKRIGGKLDPKQIQEMLMFGKNSDGTSYDNFAVALAEMAGIDADKIDPKSLNLMRYKVVEHYRQEFEKEKENFDANGNRIKDRTADQESAIKGSSAVSSGTTKSSSKKSKSEKVKEINETNSRSRGRRKGAVRGTSGYTAGTNGGGFKKKS